MLTDLREYIWNLWPDCVLDLQNCRSRKSCLKYISKEDRHLIFNCKLSELNFYYRAYEWSLKTRLFDFSDPFVVEHRFSWKFLKKFHSDVRLTLLPVFERFVKCESAYCNWSLIVIGLLL